MKPTTLLLLFAALDWIWFAVMSLLPMLDDAWITAGGVAFCAFQAWWDWMRPRWAR